MGSLYKEHADDELVALLIEGDSTAFETIYSRYARELYSYVKKSISSRPDSEEITQDIFESLWVRHKELHHLTFLKGYLYKIARYKVIRYIQHSHVKRKYEEHFKFFEFIQHSPETEEIEKTDLIKIVERGLEELPDRCRQAVELRLYAHLTNDEIARQMAISKTTVENYFVAAVKHLRKFTKKYT